VVQKADIESKDTMEIELKRMKKPLVSCDIYDEEERKALFGEGKDS
jgi:hypothetical protein